MVQTNVEVAVPLDQELLLFDGVHPTPQPDPGHHHAHSLGQALPGVANLITKGPSTPANGIGFARQRYKTMLAMKLGRGKTRKCQRKGTGLVKVASPVMAHRENSVGRGYQKKWARRKPPLERHEGSRTGEKKKKEHLHGASAYRKRRTEQSHQNNHIKTHKRHTKDMRTHLDLDLATVA